jgi:catechol 2,3-dioxygenase-like lactoylglutathione lyase family enzyme
VVEEGGRLCALRVADRQILLLCEKGACAHLPVGQHDGDGQLHLALAIRADELDAWESRLRQNGVSVEERRTWERGGHSLYLRDPDQHLLELATPGVWSIH